ncbi:circadian-associated transcriptional repressor-like [Oncorhynchus tshawytscha]|uniref:circadian-associated transcriptional repressor-like n=1 Tax=Oncorhynchus tshawytscha TaxID=74940 RepID=UPI001C3C99E8|nr:circadian-associated transcriptional repressor-like [Oncorhynchus tshawytscha]
MQSQGSTSSQPSDSLSSSDSYLFNHSEQAEDDTDVFLSERSPAVILGTGGMVRGNGSAGAESPESQWACDGFTDREEEESRGSEVTGGHPRVTAERQRTSETEREKTEGDLLFAQKCAELQGFVRPLLELLNGLKGGRFDRGLSSFQQSAAMDRIQRIVGVLRRPSIGEKYMNTLLQVETMLKMWFPQVSPLAPPTAPTLFPLTSPPGQPQQHPPTQAQRPVAHPCEEAQTELVRHRL